MSKAKKKTVSKKLTGAKPMQRYEIAIPIKETWFFTVFAKDKKDALVQFEVEKESGILQQDCSIGGWPKNSRGTPRVRKVL